MFQWIVDTVSQIGYAGIVLLMVLENLFLPIPSELIMPVAGFAAARGELSLAAVIAAGTLGSVLGALPWYYAGRWLGPARLKRLAGRHGRWMTITPDDIDTAEEWFKRYCGKAVLFGRLVPTVRTLISVPAGIARMPLSRFLLCSALGTVLWSGLLAGTGYLLESQYVRVATYMDAVSKGIIAVIVLGYLYRLVTYRGAKSSSEPAD